MNNKLLVLIGIIILVVIGMWAFIPNQTSSELKSQSTTVQKQINPTSTMETSYSLSEVAMHNSATNCWLVIEQNVYNVTDFIPQHPGGEEILKGCGKDATSLFQSEDEHAEGNAVSYLPPYLIGTVK